MRVGKFVTSTLSRVRIILFERKDAMNKLSFTKIEYELLTVSLNIFKAINTDTILRCGEHANLLLKLIFI